MVNNVLLEITCIVVLAVLFCCVAGCHDKSINLKPWGLCPQTPASFEKLDQTLIFNYQKLKVLSTFSKVAGVWGQSPQGLNFGFNLKEE